MTTIFGKKLRSCPNPLLTGLVVVLFGCAESQLVVHTAKRFTKPDKVSRPQGVYKIGNPYQIKGVWYYPAADYSYDETGIASWYGPKFHGKRTANGGIFDMNELSAAHRTLPMPSFVQVTNLENGRSLRLKVTDRGPFARGRIIDISRRGAQLLGFERKGTARIRVSILARDSRAIAQQLVGSSALSKDGLPIKSSIKAAKPLVSAQGLAPPPGAQAAVQKRELPPLVAPRAGQRTRVASARPVPGSLAGPRQNEPGGVAIEPIKPTSLYVQVGAFTLYENAYRATAKLFGHKGFKVTSIMVKGREFFRVRAGPLKDVSKADQILDYAIRTGYPDTRIVVD